MNLENFVITGSSSLREALNRINLNKHGLVFVSCEGDTVKGVVTDGDIRRHLLNKGGMEDAILTCTNKEFHWEKWGTPRELLLKKLDGRVRAIPLLDESRRLVGVFSREHAPLSSEESIYARARSPVRVSFAGGGSDLTHYFADNGGGAVINATISLYSHALLRLRTNRTIAIHSQDLGETLEARDLPEALSMRGTFGLVQALLKLINPDFGFELYLHSDYPLKSGLGGSAVVSAAILGCFNQFRRDQWDSYELAEIAYQAERLHLGVAGGWQDQYATVFGGINFMEFRMEQNLIHPLRIQAETLLELEESLVLCDSGIAHESGEIHEDQRVQMSDDTMRDQVAENAQLSYDMRNALLRGKLRDFGLLLDQAWQAKRRVSKKISSLKLDAIYDSAKQHGALGGKLLGAGGGGFFLFYAPPYQKHALLSHLKSNGLSAQSFRFEERGLQAWTVRESKNQPMAPL